MARPRPKGLPDGSMRFILWVDASGWDASAVDDFCKDILDVAVEYGKTAHIETPLHLIDPA